MAPADFAGLVIDRLDHTVTPDVIVRARPPVNPIRWLGKIDAPAWMGIDDKQSVLDVETGGTIVGHAALVGSNQASIGCRFLGGIGNRTAPLIGSQRPVHRSKRGGQTVLPVWRA